MDTNGADEHSTQEDASPIPTGRGISAHRARTLEDTMERARRLVAEYAMVPVTLRHATKITFEPFEDFLHASRRRRRAMTAPVVVQIEDGRRRSSKTTRQRTTAPTTY